MTVRGTQRKLTRRTEQTKKEEFLQSGKLIFKKGVVPSMDELDAIIIQSLTEHGRVRFLALLAKANDPALRSTKDIDISVFEDFPAIERTIYFEEVAESGNPLFVPLITVAVICSVALASVFIVIGRQRRQQETSVILGDRIVSLLSHALCFTV